MVESHIENLILSLKTADAVEERTYFHGGIDIKKNKHLEKFISFIHIYVHDGGRRRFNSRVHVRYNIYE